MALFGATASTLCLIFDPRYRDFSTALLALPALVFLPLAIAARGERSGRGMKTLADQREERLLAAVLGVGGLVVAWREGPANHQALAWMAMALVFAGAIAGRRPPAPRRIDLSADDGAAHPTAFRRAASSGP